MEKFIPGIYNYCDRWCERCTFASRCRTFESAGKLSSEELDMNNQVFWDNLSKNFQDTIGLLRQAAEKYGFDPDKPMRVEEETAYKQHKTFLRTATRQHVLIKLCKQYRHIVWPFVQKSDGFVDKTRELVDHLHLGIGSPEEVVHTVAGIGDCFDVISWYLFFIDVKLQRALHGKIEGEGFAIENNFPKDSEGSAKIALIAIEKSIDAWTRLHNLLPSSEDIALHALAILLQLKEKTTKEFPQAMQFRRPGFDD
jgi:hypothetical protein